MKRFSPLLVVRLASRYLQPATALLKNGTNRHFRKCHGAWSGILPNIEAAAAQPAEYLRKEWKRK